MQDSTGMVELHTYFCCVNLLESTRGFIRILSVYSYTYDIFIHEKKITKYKRLLTKGDVKTK